MIHSRALVIPKPILTPTPPKASHAKKIYIISAFQQPASNRLRELKVYTGKPKTLEKTSYQNFHREWGPSSSLYKKDVLDFLSQSGSSGIFGNNSGVLANRLGCVCFIFSHSFVKIKHSQSGIPHNSLILCIIKKVKPEPLQKVKLESRGKLL